MAIFNEKSSINSFGKVRKKLNTLGAFINNVDMAGWKRGGGYQMFILLQQSTKALLREEGV